MTPNVTETTPPSAASQPSARVVMGQAARAAPAQGVAGRPEIVLTLSCQDRIGIVHAVSGFLVEHSCNILDSAQFSELPTRTLFMRVAFAIGGPVPYAVLKAEFSAIAETFGMIWQMHDCGVKPRLLIMVSRLGHCINDLLFRYATGALDVEIPAIVSNHLDFQRMAASYDIPFHHLPVSPETKAGQEAKLFDLIERERIDLVVLARYMQVLSADLCSKLEGRLINIHHSFLPSFKGSKPYHQAHARGVKLIGATAHYVTPELDEGPIIEQDVARVDHALAPDDLVAIGRDVEAVVLARAIRFHIEHRVLPNGSRTVVFR